MMKRSIALFVGLTAGLLAGAILSDSAGLVFGEGDDVVERRERDFDNDRERDDDRDFDDERDRDFDDERDRDFDDERDDEREFDDDDDDDDDHDVFDRNYGLTFRIGDDESEFNIVCAMHEFGVHVEHSGDEHEGEIRIRGELHEIDDDQLVLLASVEGGEARGDNHTRIALRASARLKVGQTITLGRVDNHKIEVSLRVVD